MKKIVGKNQIMIAALAVMIAVAGYLNYSGALFGDKKEGAEEANAELSAKELLDISEDDLKEDKKVAEGENDIDGTPGEAVLTNGLAATSLAQAKVSREQVRSQNKETLQGIIDNESLGDEHKQEAVSQLIQLTEFAEQEADIEAMMASKGFAEAVVNISDHSADVIVKADELTDANRAQIEDIVTRKTEIDPHNIVITPIHE